MTNAIQDFFQSFENYRQFYSNYLQAHRKIQNLQEWEIKWKHPKRKQQIDHDLIKTGKVLAAKLSQVGKDPGPVLQLIYRVNELDGPELVHQLWPDVKAYLQTVKLDLEQHPTKKNNNDSPQPDKAAIAIGILKRHPDWSQSKIAEAVPCSASTLSRNKMFKEAYTQFSTYESPVKGSKYPNRKTGEPTIEAADPDSLSMEGHQSHPGLYSCWQSSIDEKLDREQA